MSYMLLCVTFHLCSCFAFVSIFSFGAIGWSSFLFISYFLCLIGDDLRHVPWLLLPRTRGRLETRCLWPVGLLSKPSMTIVSVNHFCEAPQKKRFWMLHKILLSDLLIQMDLFIHNLNNSFWQTRARLRCPHCNKPSFINLLYSKCILR